MNRILNLPLNILLPSVIMGLFLVMLIFTFSYRYYSQINTLQQNRLLFVKQRMTALQGELQEEFSNHSISRGEREISVFGLIHETRYLVVLNDKQQIVLSTNYDWKNQSVDVVLDSFNPTHFQTVIHNKTPLTFISSDQNSIQSYYPLDFSIQPNQSANPLTGLIYFVYDLSLARKAIIHDIILESSILAAIWLIFMGGLIGILNSIIAKPLQNLASSTLKLAKGELGIQLTTSGQKEMSQLASAFNLMSRQIEDHIVKLRRSERNLSITLDSIGDAVIVTDDQGKIVRINPIASQLTGWSKSGAINQPLMKVFNVINNQTRQPIENPIKTVLNTGQIVGLANHTVLISRDGNEYQIADSAAPIIGISGKTRGVVLVFRDVTLEYQLNQALQQSEVRFRNMVETTNDWIWEINSNACYTYVSPRCYEILGYRPGELIGKTPFDLMPDQEAKNIAAKFHQISQQQHPFTNLENINLHKNGQTVVLETSGVPFFNAKNELMGYRGIDRNITQRKKNEETLKLSIQRYQTLINYAPEALIIFDQDTLLFTDSNDNALNLFEINKKTLLQRTIIDISPAKQFDGQDSLQAINKHIKIIGIEGESSFEWLFKNSTGNVFPCEVRLVKLPDSTRNLIRSSIIDITARKQTETALLESEQRFRELFERLPNIAVQGFDPTRKIIFWNAASEKLYGYRQNEALNNKLDELIIPKQKSASLIHAIDQWAFQNQEIPAKEIELLHKQGHKIPVYCSFIKLHNYQGQTELYKIDFDLTDNHKAQAQIEKLAYYDELTNLPNRRLFLDRLKNEIAMSDRHSESCAILYLDLDNFKTINDSLGHSFGDQLLIQVGKRIKEHIRLEDTVSRFGGDEFVILLKQLDLKMEKAIGQVQLVADKILLAICQAITIDHHKLFISSSIGVSLLSPENNNPEELLKQADTAMYRAKEQGRNSIRFFESSMQIAADQRLMLEKYLRQALNLNEFFLVYQPQVNIQGDMVGVEALVRWNQPEKGSIPPGHFIPIAEETGMILQLGEWILKKACYQFTQWKTSNNNLDLHIAINVSPSQFKMNDFVYRVEQVLIEFQIHPKYITLELTEGLVINNIKDTIRKMHALKNMGFRFSIDDFGTGYSSLSYLKRLPLDQLKIDQSFIHDIENDSNDEAIVETIITMAHILDMEVIAEGVENAKQVEFLIAKGCQVFQGYYFNKPLAAEIISHKLITTISE